MWLPITIYLVSTLIMWLFIHYTIKKAAPSDLALTFIPFLNSFGVLIAITYILMDIEWDKVASKVFQVDSK